MPKILIIGMKMLFLQELARSADAAGAKDVACLVGIGWTQSLRYNSDYDVISVVTETDSEKLLIQKAIDLLCELEFKGVLVHYWGHSPNDKPNRDIPFQFKELMRQCYGSPECPLTERWATFCMDAHREHVRKGDSK